MRSAATGVPPSPPIAVVTPIRSLFSARPLRGSTAPDWSIMSIQPGETYCPRASISRLPLPATLPIAREPAVLDRDVRRDPRIAHAVEHAAVANHDVVLGRLLARHGAKRDVPGKDRAELRGQETAAVTGRGGLKNIGGDYYRLATE